MDQKGGVGAGALMLIAGLSLAAGCLLGFGLSLLWPTFTGTSVAVTPGAGINLTGIASGNNPLTPAPAGSGTPGGSGTPISGTPASGSLVPGNSQSSPVPINSAGQVETGLTLTVSNVTRPADSVVTSSNPALATPTSDKEYIEVTVTFSCTQAAGATCTYNGSSLKIVGADGTPHDRQFTGAPNELDLSGQLFGGASKQGVALFQVVKADAGVVLLYASPTGVQTYFAVR